MIEALDTLYKRDTTGKIRCWTAQFENNQWRVVSGICLLYTSDAADE